jgi:hypothetical protein
MVTSQYQWNILEWDVKQIYLNNQLNSDAQAEKIEKLEIHVLIKM